MKDITSQIYNLFKNKGVVAKVEADEEEKKGEDKKDEDTLTFDNMGDWIKSCYYLNDDEDETKLTLTEVIT